MAPQFLKGFAKEPLSDGEPFTQNLDILMCQSLRVTQRQSKTMLCASIPI